MAHRIHIVTYRPSWPSQGRRAAGRLRSALCERVDDSVCAVHHVGSTAVPGMAAQPILDLIVELGDSEASLAASRSSLLGVGYERRCPVPAPERWRGVKAIYTRDGVDRPAGQQGLLERVLVCEAGHPSIAEALAFRDYLRARPEARWAYAMRKRELVHAHDADSAAYQAGKVAFIDQVQRLADAMLGAARTAGQAEISVVRLPGWVHTVVDAGATYPTPDAMMALAVRLARENVERGTGGPFGAAVFDLDAVRLVAVG
ncbi:MAG: GrpB family protein, partial [Anaerolineae bacterium]